jgi:MraZ protein
LQRLLVGHADDVDMDATGRLLVPPALRAYAALDKRIVLVGQGNRFEIWDEARWNELTAAAMSFADGGLPPELEGFSL